MHQYFIYLLVEKVDIVAMVSRRFEEVSAYIVDTASLDTGNIVYLNTADWGNMAVDILAADYDCCIHMELERKLDDLADTRMAAHSWVQTVPMHMVDMHSRCMVD